MLLLFFTTLLFLKQNNRVHIHLLRYVPDHFKTQQMCDKTILENGGTLESFLTTTKITKCVIKQLIMNLMH